MENQSVSGFICEDEGNSREFNTVSIDQIDTNPLFHDDLFKSATRSVSVLQHFPVPLPSEDDGVVMQRPSLRKEQARYQESIVPIVFPSNINLVASEYPSFLMPNHFEVQNTLPKIYSQLESFFSESNGLSYQFDSTLCQWTLVFLNGSSHTKFHLTVYAKVLQPLTYIIEGNRLKGDGYSFRTLFTQVKSLFLVSETPDISRDFDSFSNSFPQFSSPILNDGSSLFQNTSSKSEPTCNLDCVFRMANETKIEAQLEASKILCDISLDLEMQQIFVENGGLAVLKNLIQNSACEWTQQHAIVAVSNLSDAKIFQSAIIKEGYLPLLMKLACNGPYQTAELRRSAMHILANLCSDSAFANDIARGLSVQDVSIWLNSVDSLHDERMKVHASRARDFLSRVVFAN